MFIHSFLIHMHTASLACMLILRMSNRGFNHTLYIVNNIMSRVIRVLVKSHNNNISKVK